MPKGMPSTVVTPEPDLDDPIWKEQFRDAQTLLDEAGVFVDFYSEPKDEEPPCDQH